jgi:DNA topoisomerase-1
MPTSTIFDTVVSKKGKTYVISYALGHLYRLEDANSKDKSSPIFDPVWKPLSSQRTTDTKTKSLQFKVGKILKELEFISKYATEFIHACDFDQEGEVIGHNILEFACKNKYSVSKRAKFSSLTDEEILNSFNNLLPPKYKLKDAGSSRHMIDYFYGINLSRALTRAVIESFSSKTDWHNSQVSIGRVQGPTLAFVVERENEILKHIAIPYWNIKADFLSNKQHQNIIINTTYFPEKIDSKDLAFTILKECKGKIGKVTQKRSAKTTLNPPNPFNLGDLQREAFKQFGFSPSLTLSIAEKLYLSALISYPRTSSKKLPPTIGYNKIISKLSKYESSPLQKTASVSEHQPPSLSYLQISKELLLKKNLLPNEGKDEDPAHPSIYPTGERPKKDLGELEKKLLDLIIRRFFATFGDNAVVDRNFVTITVENKHLFKTDEKKITIDGWTLYYRPYFSYSDYVDIEKLSHLKENDLLTNVDIKMIEKATQPPPRYNQSTLLQMMERENIGTKATRSEIINILLKRNYIYNFSPNTRNNNLSGQQQQQDKQSNKNNSLRNSNQEKRSIDNTDGQVETIQRSGLRPTEKGIALITSMKQYAPDIISTSLTRSLEQQLSGIELGTSTPDSVLREGRTRVTKILQSINTNKTSIGKEIMGSLAESS